MEMNNKPRRISELGDEVAFVRINIDRVSHVANSEMRVSIRVRIPLCSQDGQPFPLEIRKKMSEVNLRRLTVWQSCEIWAKGANSEKGSFDLRLPDSIFQTDQKEVQFSECR